MYDDEPYNEAEQDVVQHVVEDIENLKHGRESRLRPFVSQSKEREHRLDVNLSTKYTNQKLKRLPLAILDKIYHDLLRIELSGNDLGGSGLPSEFEKCEVLYYLKLEYCSLTRIPDVVCRLQSLVILDIRHNKLERLPAEIQDLKRLRALSLSHNQLKELPTFLTQVVSLQTIDVTGNPLEAPPRAVWDDALPQNRSLDGLARTRRIVQWLAERRPQTSSSGDINNPEPIRPGSLVPQPLNLTKPQPSSAPSIISSTTRSRMPNKSGSMDTTFSDAVTDAPDIAFNGNDAIYVARKIGKAYYQLVQHIRAELSVADASGTIPDIGEEFAGLLAALDECARDLMSAGSNDGGLDRVKSAIFCGSQLLSETLRSFLQDIAISADDDLLADIPTMFEMVDKNIVSALRDVGVQFAGGNSMDRVDSLFRIAGYGTINFAYSGQQQTGAVAVRVPGLRAAYPPIETPVGTLSYANSAMNSSADLQQAARLEDEPYELIGEVVGNCGFIQQQLNDLLAKGHMQATPPPIHRLWNDTLVAVQQLQQRAQVLLHHLANVSASDITALRRPCDDLSTAVLVLRKLLLKLAKNSNLVSDQMMTAYKRIRHSVATAMKLLDGAQRSAITPTSAVAVTSAGSTGAYPPATPMNAALGPAAARMVGKDTSSLFKKIDDLHRKERRF